MASYKEWTYTYLCLSQTSRESDGKHQGDAKWGRAFREQHYADQTSQQHKREFGGKMTVFIGAFIFL